MDVELFRRDIPSFSIQFELEDSSSKHRDLKNYNELSEVSEEYFHTFFKSVFKDAKVIHDGTALILMPSENDPNTVEFKLTLEFIIPGEVPKIRYVSNHTNR